MKRTLFPMLLLSAFMLAARPACAKSYQALASAGGSGGSDVLYEEKVDRLVDLMSSALTKTKQKKRNRNFALYSSFSPVYDGMLGIKLVVGSLGIGIHSIDTSIYGWNRNLYASMFQLSYQFKDNNLGGAYLGLMASNSGTVTERGNDSRHGIYYGHDATLGGIFCGYETVNLKPLYFSVSLSVFEATIDYSSGKEKVYDSILGINIGFAL